MGFFSGLHGVSQPTLDRLTPPEVGGDCGPHTARPFYKNTFHKRNRTTVSLTRWIRASAMQDLGSHAILARCCASCAPVRERGGGGGVRVCESERKLAKPMFCGLLVWWQLPPVRESSRLELLPVFNGDSCQEAAEALRGVGHWDKSGRSHSTAAQGRSWSNMYDI